MRIGSKAYVKKDEVGNIVHVVKTSNPSFLVHHPEYEEVALQLFKDLQPRTSKRQKKIKEPEMFYGRH